MHKLHRAIAAVAAVALASCPAIAADALIIDGEVREIWADGAPPLTPELAAKVARDIPAEVTPGDLYDAEMEAFLPKPEDPPREQRKSQIETLIEVLIAKGVVTAEELAGDAGETKGLETQPHAPAGGPGGGGP